MPNPSALLQWNEPVALTRWRWQNVTRPFCKKVASYALKFSLSVSVLPLVVAVVVLPESFLTAVFALIVVSLVPLQGVLLLWLARNSPMIYRIEQEGVREEKLFFYEQFYNWESIASHKFGNHPDLPSVRCLLVTLEDGGKDPVIQLCFDPNQVSEAEIRAPIESYLS